MSRLESEGICAGCNSTYNASALSYPHLYYACSNILVIHNLSTHTSTHALTYHKGKINCVALNKEDILTGSTDKTLAIWRDFSVFFTVSLSSSVIFITTSKSFLASITNDGTLSIFNSTYELFQSLSFKKNLQETCAILEMPSNTLLATAGVDSKIHIYSLGSVFEYQVSLESHVRNIRSLSFTSVRDCALLVSAGQDCLIRIWKFSSDLDKSDILGQGVYEINDIKCRLDAVLTGHSNLISSVQWIGNEILSCSHDFTVMLWHEDLSSGTWINRLTLGQLGGNKNVFLGAVGDSSRILAYTYSGGFYHWEKTEETWTLAIAPTGHNNQITGLVVNQDYVLTCSLDQTCRLWTYPGYWLESSRPMVHGYDINAIASYSHHLISGADEKILRIFSPSSSSSEILEAQGFELPGTVRGSSQVLGLTTKGVTEVEFDFRKVTITEDLLSSYTLWPELHKLYGHGYEIECVDVHNQLLASACRSRNKEHACIFIWNLESKTRARVLEFHTLGVTDLAFSSDGQWLVSVSRDQFWCLFHMEKGSNLAKKGHGREVYVVAWNEESTKFVTGSRDKKMKIWDLQGDEVACFLFEAAVCAASWVKERVLVGLEDGCVWLVDWKNGDKKQVAKCGGKVVKIKARDEKVFLVSADHTFRVFRIIE